MPAPRVPVSFYQPAAAVMVSPGGAMYQVNDPYLRGPTTFDSSGPVMKGFNIDPSFAPWTTGGTSGDGSGRGSNVLNINLGGSSLKFDLGPNTDYFSQGAYNFLDNSFQQDKALLGGTIIGSQNFLLGAAAPLAEFNTTSLPAMFAHLSDQNFAIGTQAIAAQTEVAKASIEGSRASAQAASSGGGGFCFITTAVCEVIGEADDGPTLTALRSLRDGYMMQKASRREMVKLYYLMAPQILERIKLRRDWREVLESFFTVYILPARNCIQRGQEIEAYNLYVDLMYHAMQLTGMLYSQKVA